MNKSNEDRVISHLCDYIEALRGGATASPLLLKGDTLADVDLSKDKFIQENGIRSPHPTINLCNFLLNKTAERNSLHIDLVEGSISDLEVCDTVCISMGKNPKWLKFTQPKLCEKKISECAMCHGRKTIDGETPCIRCDGVGVC